MSSLLPPNMFDRFNVAPQAPSPIVDDNTVVPITSQVVAPTVSTATPVIVTASDAAFFPVSLGVLNHSVNGKTYSDSGFRAVVDDEIDCILGVHKSRYKLVRNEEVITQFEEALRHSELDATGMKIKTRFSHNRARMYREYILPKHAVDPKPGDTIELRLTLNNSYDGSLCFDYAFGGYRRESGTGLVVPNGELTGAYRKHTAGIDIASIAKALSRGAERYKDIAEDWTSWTKKPITEEQAVAIISKISSLTDETREMILGYFKDERVNLGSTVWAVYNAISYWSTHQNVRSQNTANLNSIIRDREQRVSKALKSPDFLAVA